jgi:hypothetical protein
MLSATPKYLLVSDFYCIAFVIAFTLAGCTDDQNAKPNGKSTWKSTHHPIDVTFSEPWSLVPAHIDTQEKVLVGFIDSRDGKSYVIKLADDALAEDLGDEDYIAAIKNQMLSANSKNRFIDQKKELFHGREFHRLQFTMHTPKWGTLRQIAYFSRLDGKFVSVQLSFPYEDQSVAEIQIPDAISVLDRGVRIFDSEREEDKEN